MLLKKRPSPPRTHSWPGLVLGGVLALSQGGVLRAGGAEAARIPRRAAYRITPGFEANRGQAAPDVRYLARGRYGLFLTSTETVLRRPGLSGRADAELRLRFASGNPAPVVEGLEEQPTRVNYFAGRDAASWRTGIPTYARVRSRDVYPGIDVVFYAKEGKLEFDLVVAPGADPSAIRLEIDGAEDLALDAEGDLVLRVSGDEVRLRKPLVYQEDPRGRKEVAGAYLPRPVAAPGSPREVAFRLDTYDAARPLVIDPVVVYSTYVGGPHDQHADELAVGPDGSVFLTGNAGFSPPPPGLGQVDIFTAKVDAGGGLVYITYLGGTRSEGLIAHAATDGNGNLYAAGETFSPNFPVTPGSVTPTPGGVTPDGRSDGFVFKLDATGAIVYSTLLGGTSSDAIRTLLVDHDGFAYLCGFATGGFQTTADALQQAPTANPSFGDAFLTKLHPTTGNLVYSTLLGGDSGDFCGDIALDGAGAVYMTGTAGSPNFPTTGLLSPAPTASNAQAFVAKIDLAATPPALVYSVFLGGSNREDGSTIVVDAGGHAYVTGNTSSADFPAVNPVQPGLRGFGDLYVARLAPTGTSLVYATWLGGSGDETGAPKRPALDGNGNLIVAGTTPSADFPTAHAAQAVFRQGFSDAFVTKLDPAGNLVYSTLLGSNGQDATLAVDVDAQGNAHVAGFWLPPFSPPVVPFPSVNAIQPVSGGGQEGFLTKLNPSGAILYSTSIGGAGSDVVLDLAVGPDGDAYVTGFTNSSDFPTVAAIQTTLAGTGDAFLVRIHDENTPPTAGAGGPYSVAEGGIVTLTATGSDPEGGTLAYEWDLDGDSTFETTGASVTFAATALDGPSSAAVTVRVTDPGGLSDTESATVDVTNAPPTATFTIVPSAPIAGECVTLALGNATDPSLADRQAGFTYSFDCAGDGYDVVDASGSSLVCSYTAGGGVLPKASLKDKDEGSTEYSLPVTVLAPEGAIEQILGAIEALVDLGFLDGGQGNALTAKAQAAIAQIEKGHLTPAINQLGALVNQLQAFVGNGTLPPALGVPLIDGVNRIIAALQHAQGGGSCP